MRENDEKGKEAVRNGSSCIWDGVEPGNFAHPTGNSTSPGVHNTGCSISMKTFILKSRQKYENNQ
jgi:hypothetical protein